MKKLVVILAAMAAMSVRPAAADIIVFTANLLASNDVPPVDSPIVGMAVVTVVDDPFLNRATAAFDVYLTGLPAGSTIVGADLRQGLPGATGPVRVDSGISPTNPVVPTGSSVIFRRSDRLVVPNDAVAIEGDPSRFYVEVRTTFNPTVAVRGQLERVDPFQFALPFPGLVAKLYLNQTTYVAGDLFRARLVAGSFEVPRQADIFVGLTRTLAESAALCPTPGDRALQFRGPGGTTSVECQSNLTKAGNHAIPLFTNVTIPTQGLSVIPLVDETMTLPPGQRSLFVCAATPGTVQKGIPTLVRCTSATFTVLLP
jgi:CHRD domain-containing protein